MLDYHFESNGLFLGLLSYPYYIDGKKLFTNVIEPFFSEHRKRLDKYDIKGFDNAHPVLYQPNAYRMFGTQGLAVLSLIDDYSFCSRHFNKNHIQTLLGDPIDIDNYKFKSIVVTGITERSDAKMSIMDKAKSTFLKEKNRFPFVGIIRLKIDHRILLGKGVSVIRAIKDKVDALFDEYSLPGVKSDYIIVDCFDNDEMTIISFSNSIRFLIQFLGNVRNIKSEQAGALQYKEDNKIVEKHVFASTYISFGYDVKYWVGNKQRNEVFLPSVNDERTIKLNCLIETRPGHRDSYKHYLDLRHPKIKVVEKIASGGSVLKANVVLSDIQKLEVLCSKKATIRDVRKMRVSLIDPIEEQSDKGLVNHAKNFETKSIEKQAIADIKKNLKAIGVSKIVRDRLLALFELYNNSKRNLIQTLYFEELSGIVFIFHQIINDQLFAKNIDVKSLEKELDGEITALENACYDRIHNRKYAENLLEYSGGIQQHLTAFGNVYYKINKVFTCNNIDKYTYTIITGSDRVSSRRFHLKLNINHILFPELFVTTIWKEASNKNVKILDKFNYLANEKDPYQHKFFDIINLWNDFIKNEDTSAHVKNLILQDTQKLLKNDETFACFNSIMDENLLLYFIKDYIVFHFAYQRDYEKLWHFYFKVFLQTTNCYHRLGEVKRVHVVYMLLRLFMIGLRADAVNNDSNCKGFIKQQKKHTFDSILRGYWIECYEKTFKIAEHLFNLLCEYGFLEASEYQVAMCEINAEEAFAYEKECITSGFCKTLAKEHRISFQLLLKANKKCIDNRKDTIERYNNAFDGFALIEKQDLSSFEFIVCLLTSFISRVYQLDMKDANKYYPIKSIPRDKQGEIINELDKTNDNYIKELYDEMIGIPCDTTGGFFLPQAKTRSLYFTYRSVLYRSLWNFRMVYDY